MESRYHAQVTRLALAPHFAAPDLDEVVRANLGQDALRYQLGGFPHFHFDSDRIAEGRAYVEAQHTEIAVLAQQHTAVASARQRRALGRLLHAVQDFYAHSSYVDLWLARHTVPGQPLPPAESIDALDPALLTHPELISGSFVFWRDVIFYVPVLGWLARRIWGVPATSHEGMNLDAPKSGFRFAYAFEAARQRSRYEVGRALDAVHAAGGPSALFRFTGVVG